jgi:predicted nucleic acid-binding protein
MAFTVVYDACVLFPAPLRDLLLRVASLGLVRARWTELILDETFRSLQASRPDLAAAALQRTRSLMNAAVRDCLVTGFESLVDGVTLPDPDDRHVVAAAIRSGAQVIVTWNLKDFPSASLERFSMEAQSPDDFVLHLLHLAPGLVASAVTQQAADLKRPPVSRDQLLETLLAGGLVRSVARLRELFASPG